MIPEQDDAIEKKAAKVKRVIACSGKVYYDLVKKRTEKEADDVAIIRGNSCTLPAQGICR